MPSECPASGGRRAALPAVPVEEPRAKGTSREGSGRSGVSGRSVRRCGAAPNVANGALISVQVPKGVWKAVPSFSPKSSGLLVIKAETRFGFFFSLSENYYCKSPRFLF